MSLTSGTRIGPYEIISLIGKGRMGDVYKGRDYRPDFNAALKVSERELHESVELKADPTNRADGTSPDRDPIAIKVMGMIGGAYNANISNNPKRAEVENFLSAVETATSLRHPAIIRVINGGNAPIGAYLAMELFESQPLNKFLAVAGLLEPSQALDILRQVASALDYAHGRSLVHANLSPRKVLFNGSVRITGFAFAALEFEVMNQYWEAFLGPTVESIGGIAPEAAIQGQKCDSRADQFSLAWIAFELLTGKRPFLAPDLGAFIYAVSRAERPFAHQMNSSLPPVASDVLRQGLAVEPNDRFLTCGEFIAALEAALC